MHRLRRYLLPTALLAAALHSPLHAGQATGTFQVNATIVAACVVSATDLGFGTYNPAGGADVDGTSTVNVYCTSGTPYTVSLNVGTGGGTFATRTLVSGASQTLNFNLYTSGAYTTVWGDGTASTGTVAGSGAGLLTSSPHTVHGRLFQGQDRAPAAYASTITVTVDY